MSIWTFCESVAAETVAGVAGFESGAAFGGEFDLTEARRQSFQTPAVFVTCEGTERTADGYHRAAMVMIVVAKSRPQNERAVAAMALVSKVLAWIDGQSFQDGQVKAAPANIRSRNLYGAKADQHGVALWAITWETDLELVNEEPDELPPAEIVAEWDLAPDADGDIEKTDEIDLNP